MKTLLTEEKFNELLKTQSDFDGRISTINLEDSKTAWYVELVEWFNTIEPFKNWKQNKGKPKDVQLGELADVLAFGLSIYLQVDERDDDRVISAVNEFPDSELAGQQVYNLDFLQESITHLYLMADWEMAMGTLIIAFIIACDMYTVDELLEAYEQKMQVNHKRQDNGY